MLDRALKFLVCGRGLLQRCYSVLLELLRRPGGLSQYLIIKGKKGSGEQE
jgi:hypothetical protein